MWFSCFPVLTGSAEAQVISGGIVKYLLIAYFIGNICAKKISKSIHVRQSYSKPKVGRFLRHGVQSLTRIGNVIMVQRRTRIEWGIGVFTHLAFRVEHNNHGCFRKNEMSCLL